MLGASAATAQTPEPAEPVSAVSDLVVDFSHLEDVELELELLAEEEVPHLQTLLLQAEKHLRRNQTDAALEVLEQLPASGAHRPLAQRLLAWAHYQREDHAALARVLVGIERPTPELRFLAAVAQLRLSQNKDLLPLRKLWWQEGASAWGLAAVRYLSDARRVYGVKQRSYIHRHVPRITVTRGVQGDRDRMLQRLARAAPRNTVLKAEVELALGRGDIRRDPRGATRTLTAALGHTKDPQLRRAIGLRLGEVYRHRGYVTTATEHFDQVAEGHVDDLAQDAITQAAQMFVAHGRYDEARQRFQLQLLANPVGKERQAAMWGLGWVAFRMGAYPDARQFFHTVLAEEPYGPRADAALYWGARAAAEMGRGEEARAEWVHLLERFPISYYAYQAVKQLGAEPWPDPVPTYLPTSHHPEVQRIADWVDAGLTEAAEEALQRLVESAPDFLGPRDLEKMAALSEAVGDRRLAVRYRYRRHRHYPLNSAVGLAPLRRQFPDALVQMVRREARRQGVEGDLAAALVRQESGYNVNALSPSGALGLMQLMPATAAELLGKPALEDPATVLRPSTNIRLGVRYLRRMQNSFGDVELALAAYNAGPGSVGRWLRERGKLPMDIFVEEIPYRETRDYVRRIMGWYRALRMVRGVLPAPTETVVARR